MYTYGNNALSIAETSIVETMTAYTDKEISNLVEAAYNLGRRKERLHQRRERRKRKALLEEIKFFIGLSLCMIGSPVIMFLWWLAFGY